MATPGTCALVVEDDILVALEAEAALTAGGIAVVAIARSADDALRRLAAQRVDLAVVAVAADEAATAALCRQLLARDIGVVLVSADWRHAAGLPGLDGVVVVIKPFTDQALLGASRLVLATFAAPPLS